MSYLCLFFHFTVSELLPLNVEVFSTHKRTEKPFLNKEITPEIGIVIINSQ